MPTYTKNVEGKTERGDFGIENPGTYHLIIDEFDPAPADNEGNLMQGFRLKCTVLNGTHQINGICPERGKTQRIFFSDPDLSWKQFAQDNAVRRQERLLYVLGFIKEEDFGKQVSFDTDEAQGMQFIAKFKTNKYTVKRGKNKGQEREVIELDNANIYHPHDPNVADVPKDENQLKMVPKEGAPTAPVKQEKKTEYAEPAATQNSEVDLDAI